MPQGVNVEVHGDGTAVIEFVDPAQRGPGLAALLAIGGPETIEVDTRSGPRTRYTVPEGNAREAGLLDGAATAPVSKPEPEPVGSPEAAVAPAVPDASRWPEGEPTDEWKRTELDAYALAHGIDTTEAANKAAALAVIQEAKK